VSLDIHSDCSDYVQSAPRYQFQKEPALRYHVNLPTDLASVEYCFFLVLSVSDPPSQQNKLETVLLLEFDH
jgi:hypothetical protein